MYAIRNLFRLKGKSFLTFTIAFLILFLSMFGVFVVGICEDSRASFWGPLDGSIHVTDEALSPFLNYDVAELIGNSSEVLEKIAATAEYTVHLVDVSHIGMGEMQRSPGKMELPLYERGTKKIDYRKGFSLQAVSSMAILDEVFTEELIITEGSMITEEDNASRTKKIVISRTVAEQNGLRLGDTIKLDSLSLYLDDQNTNSQYLGFGVEEGRYYEFVPYVIGGIYEHRTDNAVSAKTPVNINENKVFVPISSLVDLSKGELLQKYIDNYFNDSGMSVKTEIVPSHLYFYMTDASKVEVLENELNEVGFLKNIKLTPYISDAASSPSARLSEIVRALLIGVIIFGFAVLVLSVIFHMKARHRELAVLSALGKKRGAVARSFFTEVSVLTILALFLGSGLLCVLVYFFAEPIGAYLVASEFSASIMPETADLFLIESGVQDTVTSKMGELSYLMKEYAMPSIVFSVLAGFVILLGIYIVVYGYVRNINALSGVGGKE